MYPACKAMCPGNSRSMSAENCWTRGASKAWSKLLTEVPTPVSGPAEFPAGARSPFGKGLLSVLAGG